MCLIVGNPVYVLTPHVLSEWMVEVCGAYLCGLGFVLVLRLCFELVLYCILYIYYYILYIILYIYITIIIHILYYTLLLFSSILLRSILSSSSSLLFFPSLLPPSQSQYSFYTCRYLQILIYILSFQYPFPI
jgi:hypothetical protein